MSPARTTRKFGFRAGAAPSAAAAAAPPMERRKLLLSTIGWLLVRRLPIPPRTSGVAHRPVHLTIVAYAGALHVFAGRQKFILALLQHRIQVAIQARLRIPMPGLPTQIVHLIGIVPVVVEQPGSVNGTDVGVSIRA